MSESQLIEYKESWREEHLKWICGFANAQGGTLFIGIDDKGKVCGVANAKKLLIEDPYLTNPELAEICNLTEDGIFYNIKKLKSDGLIRRVGPNKGGRWIVNKQHTISQ